MPVQRSTRSAPGRHRGFVDRLVAQFRDGRPRRQPILLEDRIGRSDSLTVTVIWDGWDKLEPGDRSDLILEAYQALDPATADRIAVVQGLTMREAISRGVLPFRIETTCKLGDPASSDQLRQALLDEGAIESPNGLELRFRTQDEAKRAYVRLLERIPGPHWVIVHEVPQPD